MNDEFEINKNDIFYQKLAENSLCSVENILNLNEINEVVNI